jgi:hypothetical protein
VLTRAHVMAAKWRAPACSAPRRRRRLVRRRRRYAGGERRRGGQLGADDSAPDPRRARCLEQRPRRYRRRQAEQLKGKSPVRTAGPVVSVEDLAERSAHVADFPER